MLTPKNRQAIDLYLSTDPDCGGSGPDCWQRGYGTKSRASAWNGWSRMMKNDEAQVYLERRQAEISERLFQETLYDRQQVINDLVRVRQDAMQHVCVGKVARKVKTRDKETGEEVEEVEYAPVTAMYSHSDAVRAGEAALRAMGDHPDQRAQGAGVQVAININTQWRGHAGAESIDVTETPDEPPEFEDVPPRVVLIGKK